MYMNRVCRRGETTMADIEQDVNELYNRAEEIRQQAQLDSRKDGERRPDRGRPRRRLANRIVMFVLGAGMVTYGVINMAARMMYEGAGPPPAPSLGTFTSTQTVNSCQAGLQSLDEVNASPTDAPSEGLSAEQAEQTADSLLRRYLGFDANSVPVLLSGPALVDLELPDGTRQQAWGRLWIPDVNPVEDDLTQTAGPPAATPGPTATTRPAGTANPSEAAANPTADDAQLDNGNQANTRGVDAYVLYISAATGDPLVLIQDLKVQDPLLAGCEETAINELSETFTNRFQSLPSLILNIALLIVGFVALLSWQRGR